MNVMTENGVLVSEKVLGIHLEDPGNGTPNTLPAPVTEKTVKIDKYATEVNLDVTLYLEAGFNPELIQDCIEVIVDSKNKDTETRIISIVYDYTLGRDQAFVPYLYNLTIPGISTDKKEIKVIFYLVNADPVTSRGTTTTVKREM
jgi:hypothetical protein